MFFLSLQSNRIGKLFVPLADCDPFAIGAVISSKTTQCTPLGEGVVNINKDRAVESSRGERRPSTQSTNKSSSRSSGTGSYVIANVPATSIGVATHPNGALPLEPINQAKQDNGVFTSSPRTSRGKQKRANLDEENSDLECHSNDDDWEPSDQVRNRFPRSKGKPRFQGGSLTPVTHWEENGIDNVICFPRSPHQFF